MDSKNPKLQKTTVKIWRPIMEKLERKLDEACLRRDAFLAKVINTEAGHLDSEVTIPNSKASYDYVAKCLDGLDTKPVTLALPVETVTRLNDICHNKMIVRGAFFNRLFLLLAASPRNIDILMFGTSEWRQDLWKDIRSFSDDFLDDLSSPIVPTVNPLWAIRAMMEEDSLGECPDLSDKYGYPVPKQSIYTKFFDLKIRDIDLTGTCCFLSDWRIPGTEEAKNVADLDAIIAEGRNLL